MKKTLAILFTIFFIAGSAFAQSEVSALPDEDVAVIGRFVSVRELWRNYHALPRAKTINSVQHGNVCKPVVAV